MRGAIAGSAILVIGACSSFGSTPVDDGGAPPGIDASSDAVDPSTEASVPADASVDGAKLVFLTSGTFRGNLGGVAGADQYCMDAAKASPILVLRERAKVAPFKALLGEVGMNPFARFPAKTTYVLPTGGSPAVTTDGFVAFQMSITRPIDVDDKGDTRTGQNVWTGINLDGGAGPNDCSKWTSADSGGRGFHGDTDFKDLRWVSSASEGCNADNRLYCVEE